jgi:hypothetical protein
MRISPSGNSTKSRFAKREGGKPCGEPEIDLGPDGLDSVERE